MIKCIVSSSLALGGVVGACIGATKGIDNYDTHTRRTAFEHTVYMTSEILGMAAAGAVVGVTFPISAPAIILYKYKQEQNST